MHEPTTVDQLGAIYYTSDMRSKSRTKQAFNSIVAELSQLPGLEKGRFSRTQHTSVFNAMQAVDAR